MNKKAYLFVLIFLFVVSFSVYGQVIEYIPLGKAIANDTTFAYDWKYDDSDLEWFQDKKIDFSGQDIDIREFLVPTNFNGGSPSVETSLSSSDDDYEDNIFLETEKASIKYFYGFDDAINVSKATSLLPLNITFLGDDLSVIQVYSSISLQVRRGETSQIVTDGDSYFGDADWIWNIGNLRLHAVTGLSSQTADPSGPFIGIENEFVKNDDTDDPAGIGECYNLPNNYASVCLDSLTIADDEYLPVTIEYEDGVDTTKSGHPNGSTSAKTIYIHAPGDDRFVIKTAGWTAVNHSNTVNNAKTSEIWLWPTIGFANETGNKAWANATAIFFKDSDQTPSTVYAGMLNASTNTKFTIAQIDFEDTESTNALIQYHAPNNANGKTVLSANDHQRILLNFTGDSTTELADGSSYFVANFSMATAWDELNGLGASRSSEEAGELTWKTTNIGTRDEDHRGLYGEVVKDPKSNGASDQVVVLVPADQVQANIAIRQGCFPEWHCIGYGLCVTNLKYCNDVEDINSCDVIYIGNFSEFPPQSCSSLNESALEEIQQTLLLIQQDISELQSQVFSLQLVVDVIKTSLENAWNAIGTNFGLIEELQNRSSIIINQTINQTFVINNSYYTNQTFVVNNTFYILNDSTLLNNYFPHLSKSDRKKLICGYAEEKNLTQLIDLGLECNLTYKYSSRGRLSVRCRCDET